MIRSTGAISASLLMLAGCSGSPGAAVIGVPPPVTKAVALPGYAVKVHWQAQKAMAAFVHGDGAPSSRATRTSLLASAVEAATNCTVVDHHAADDGRRLETRLDCSRRPLVSL